MNGWIEALRKAPDTRDRLYDKISRGGRIIGAGHGRVTWTIARGEKVAIRLGLPSFEHSADPLRFDPMREPAWSLSMALAWIIYREVDEVREAWDAWRMGCRRWSPWRQPRRPPGQEPSRQPGWRDLETLEPLTIASLIERAKLSRALDGRKLACGPFDAENELRSAMVAGSIKAMAVDRSGRPAEVPAREWHYLRLTNDDRSARRPAVLVGTGGANLRYSDVLIDREALLRLFPAHTATIPSPEADPGEQASLQPVSPVDIEAAFKDFVTDRLPGRATVEECERFLTSVDPTMKRQEMRALRKRIAPEDWARPGKPKRRPAPA